MDNWLFITLVIVALLLAGFFAVRYIKSLERRDNIRSLMGQRYSEEEGLQVSDGDEFDDSPRSAEDEIMSRLARKKGAGKKKALTLEERMFQAGLFSEEQRKDFRRLQVVMPTAFGLLGVGYGSMSNDPLNIIIYGVIGGMLGTYIPLKRLDGWIKKRQEEILFYLPLVIEQISIGVSSSLDIGPCLARVVQMADERDSHNPVTELLRFAQAYIKSGVNLQDALNEVGRQSGSNEVKHAFKALAQVARYGGEISKQLQDLSESVSSERETKVDEKIKKLELAATGPVALVFAGFLFILLVGFGMTLLNAMGGRS
jgi:Flp pilus assembly protein TadB